MKAPSPGMRTFLFGVFAMTFLLVGYSLALTFTAIGATAFSTFATTVGAIVASVSTKHAVESLASGSGIAGAVKALVTDSKPPEGA